jgi:HSP20 family protein
MSLVKFNPVRDLLSFEKEISKLFNEFDNTFGFRKSNAISEEMENAVWAPLTDIYEDENNYSIKIDLPGVAKDDLKISYENGALAVSGERKSEKETKDAKYHRVERTYGKFYRSFALPQQVNQDKIEAEFSNGQLEITIPKAEEAKPKQLQIKVK